MKRNKMLLLTGALLTLSITQSNCQTAATELAQISTTGGTISGPGSFYLGFDVTGDITLASNVILDLNGHLVTGSIVIPTNCFNVAVMNGFVTNNETSEAISAESCDNIELNNITVRKGGQSDGICISRCSNVTIKDVICLGTGSANGDGLALIQCVGVTVCNSLFSNFSSGLSTDSDMISSNTTNGYVIEECTAYSNRNNGFLFGNLANGQQVFNCIALANSQSGIQIGSTGVLNQTDLFDCIADGNLNGFIQGTATGNTDSSVMRAARCFALKNMANGFLVNNNRCLLESCTSLGNTTNGFLAQNDAATVLAPVLMATNNYADGNSTQDFNPVGNTPFNPREANNTNSPRAQFWRNTTRATTSNNC